MATGQLIRFNESRGYGFIAPDNGSEDVFVHANDLLGEKYLFRPGVHVSFEIEDGERGLKASVVRLVDQVHPPVTRHALASVAKPADGADPGEDALCDLLSIAEFRQELTEALLREAPSLTGAQITQVRNCVIQLGRTHKWVDN